MNAQLFAHYPLLLFLGVVAGSLSHYKAGVVEYHYNINPELKPEEILFNNVKKYVEITESFAKIWPEVTEGILVFPECGLTSLSNKNFFSVKVPKPDFAQDDFSKFPVIGNLSSAARSFNTWLVVNLVEKDGNKNYNTDVVFRSNGTIAATYRKYNLFGEPVDKPDKAEAVSFTTSFNVTFGIFTCFDILYSHPALDLVRKGIKHFVFPTAWFSELPFLTAIQYQKSWSWANDVTLLASGLGNASEGSSGSGIYIKRTGNDLVYQTINSTDNKLIMALLDSKDEETIHAGHESFLQGDPNKKPPGLKLKQEHLNAYTTDKIRPDKCTPEDDIKHGQIVNCTIHINQSLCNHDLCCQFDLTVIFNIYVCTKKSCKDAEKYRSTEVAEDDFSLSVHRIAAFNGVRSFDVTTGGLQTCAVVPCRNGSISSCGLAPISHDIECFTLEYNKKSACVLHRYISRGTINGKFIQKNAFVTPNILLRGNDPKIYFGKISNNIEMTNDGDGFYNLSFSLSPPDVLGTVAIWNRIFDRDGEHVTGTSSSQTPLSFVILLTIILLYPALRLLKCF